MLINGNINQHTLEDTVAVQLVHDQVGVQDAAGLELIRNNTADEVGTGGVQGLDQLVQLLAVSGRDGHSWLSALLAAAALLRANVREQAGQQLVPLAVPEQGRHGHVDRVLVLLQPAVDGVGDDARVVLEVEVGLEAGALLGLGLGEGGVLAQVLLVHLLSVGEVGALGHHALLLEHLEDAHLGADQINGGLCNS